MLQLLLTKNSIVELEDVEIVVDSESNGQRLDVAISRYTQLSRATVQRLIDNGNIFINQSQIRQKSWKIQCNDRIVIQKCQQRDVQHIKPMQMDLNIIDETEDFIIINKPSGLVTHPGIGNRDSTLLNAIIWQYQNQLSDINGPEKLGIVHRLDKDTSGLIVIAKNNKFHVNITKQMQTKQFRRKYLGICHGVPVPSSATIQTFLSKLPQDHRTVIVSSEGRNAITHYKLQSILASGACSLVEFTLDTGRTHQIRVHCLHMKHPMVGDQKYFNHKYRRIDKLPTEQKESILLFPRQALHAYKISFFDETENTERTYLAAMPNDMEELIKILQ